MLFEMQKNMLNGFRINTKDVVVAWAGKQGFFPTDLQIAELVASITDAQVAAVHKMINNLLDTVVKKEFAIEKINEYWPYIESNIRLAQAFTAKPAPKMDPKDLLVLFSQDKHEKGDDDEDNVSGS